MEVVGGISGIITLVSAVTKLAKQLNDVRDRYNSVALNTTLVASQLNTIRAALEALHEWRSNDRTDTDQSKQLDTDLGVSLSCCAILITVIDGKLGESGYTPGMKQKIRYVWLEDILKEYLSNLEGQVRALQLLLTIYQCKTATEQRQRLERAESRRIIENVRVETQTLRTENKDFSDAASVLSLDPSVNFDFDAVLMRHPAYVTVYGEVSYSSTTCNRTTADLFPVQRPLPPVPKVPAQRTPPPVPDRALKPPPVPPPPPPRRRKPVWNLYLGQAVDVGTVSRTDSGEAGGRPNEQDYGKTAEQHLPAEQLPKSASTFAEPPGSTGNVNELLDEKVGAKATEQDTSIDHNHGRTPTIAETLGGSGNTAYASPPLVDSVPSKIGDSVTSLSAIDGLRGEMDLAFGSKQQSEVLKQHSRLSTASLRLSAESLVETPGVGKAATSLASSPQSPGWLGGHSRTASKQNDPEIPISQPAGSDDFHDRLRPNGSPQLEIVAHHESIKDARPSSLDSDLYSATTRSASLTSVNREPETSVGRDAPTTSQVAATTIGNQESIAKRPADASESRDANPERSSAISNYLATTTVFEVLNPGLKRQSNPKEDPISSQPIDFSQIPADRGSPSSLGLDPQIIQNISIGRAQPILDRVPGNKLYHLLRDVVHQSRRRPHQ